MSPRVKNRLKRIGRPSTLAVIVLAGLATQALAETIPVHIAGGQTSGHGLAIGTSQECFVLAPAHVLDTFYSEFEVTFPSGRRATGEPFWTLGAGIASDAEHETDLSLLRLDPSPECARATIDPVPVAKLLGSSAEAVVLTQALDVLERNRVFVSRVETELVVLDPRDSVIRSGYSGSTVTINNQPVALLLRIQTDQPGLKAIRLDRAMEFVAPALHKPEIELQLTIRPGAGVQLPADFDHSVREQLDALHEDLTVIGVEAKDSALRGVLEITELSVALDREGRESIAGRIFSSRYAIAAQLTVPSGDVVLLSFETQKNSSTPPRQPAYTATTLICEAVRTKEHRILESLALSGAPQRTICR